MNRTRFASMLPLLLLLLAACASTVPADPTPGVHPALRGAPANVALPARAAAIGRPGQETAAWWFRDGAITAREAGDGVPKARNLILFVGDGMSLATVAAARILEGQRAGAPGEEHRLAFEHFPHTALSRTYNTDSQTPDSAGTMTAMVTGVKTRMGRLSVDQHATVRDCAGSKAALVTMLELAEIAGLATGIVTTTSLTHATPAAAYAHVPDRDWAVDGDLPAAARDGGCVDIARQFTGFDTGDGIEVALGGGRGKFLPAGARDIEHPGVEGERSDGRDLVAEWQARDAGAEYVWNAAGLAAVDPARTRRLLGLFEPGHMNYEHDRAGDVAGEPSLAQMTRAALAMLQKNPRGFLLVVEGGRIDHAHHAGNAFRALSDTVAFSEAIAAARALTADSDTLILVTADHSHTLNFIGYPARGNPILGKVVGASDEGGKPGLATDALGLPYTTLSYANGPGYAGASDVQPQGAKRFPHRLDKVQAATGRPDLSGVDTTHPDFMQEATLPLGSETHGGEDVGVWASGPGAAAVRGSIEQNVLFHLMVQAQPDLVRLLCRTGHCEGGVPVALPTAASLRRGAAAESRPAKPGPAEPGPAKPGPAQPRPAQPRW